MSRYGTSTPPEPPNNAARTTGRKPTHPVPQAALGQRSALALCGTDYRTGDGTCGLAEAEVADLAEAHLLALDYTAKTSGAFNLGSGLGFTNKEVIETARRVTGHAIPVNEQPRRAGDPPELVASQELARSELGWTPWHPELEDIIGSAWRWHQAHPTGYAS